MINTNNLNSVINQTKINARILCSQMKFHRQYVNFLHLVVTIQLSDEVSCDEHCTLGRMNLV